MSSLARFDKDGLELFINLETGECFASQRGVARMVEVSETAIRNYLTANQIPTKPSEIPTSTGFKTANLIAEQGILQITSHYRPELILKFAQAGLRVYLHRLAGFELEVKQVQLPQPQVEEMSETELETHRKCIEMFQDSGDLQLAQLMKTRLGNKLLREQQQLTSTSNVVEQYEGVVDVALRLRFQVPKNYESSLGKYVKSRCGHLLIGQNNRYSTASHKQIPANMYPAYNLEVEAAVKEYCVAKAFRNRNVQLLN